MVFNRLTDSHMPFNFGDVTTESDVIDTNEKVEGSVMNDDVVPKEGVAMHYFGELPISFRSLLKRFASGNYITFHRSTGSGVCIYTFPTYTGTFYPLTSGSRDRPAPNLYNYLKFAYMGMRGSLRRRVRVCMTGGNDYFMGNKAPAMDFKVDIRLLPNSDTTLPLSIVESGENVPAHVMDALS